MSWIKISIQSNRLQSQTSALDAYQPQLLKSYGLTNLQTGLVNSIPSGIAAVAMALRERNSDASTVGAPRCRCF